MILILTIIFSNALKISLFVTRNSVFLSIEDIFSSLYYYKIHGNNAHIFLDTTSKDPYIYDLQAKQRNNRVPGLFNIFLVLFSWAIRGQWSPLGTVCSGRANQNPISRFKFNCFFHILYPRHLL